MRSLTDVARGVMAEAAKLNKHRMEAHLMLTMTAPPDSGSNPTLHYHETATGPGARLTIGGLKVQTSGSPSRS